MILLGITAAALAVLVFLGWVAYQAAKWRDR